MRKILILILCSLSVMCPVTAYANILNGGQDITLPDIPDEVYGHDYILLWRNSSEFYLFILEDDSITASSSGGDSNVITLTGWTDSILWCKYSFGDSGWSEPTYYTFGINTITPPSVYILESTFDIYKTGDPDTLIFEKNADIIFESDDSNSSYEEETTEEVPTEDDVSGDDSSEEEPTEETPSEEDSESETLSATSFHFIAEPETTIDLLYNLLLMDSIAAFAYLGFRSIKTVFARIRRFRNFKRGDE